MNSPMLHAVRLALQAQGQTAPNPCVGAVLTKGGLIAATGWHKGPGLPHAEVEALQEARERGWDLTDLTLWVTLEPCNHQGRTPPCTQAILEAGIPKVMIGTLDPNPEVAGGGANRLRRHGVKVTVGEQEQACLDLISDFTAWTLEHRPVLRLKLASTLDGRIATRTGHSSWVTGERARQRVQAMRAQSQAVLIGGQTFVADNPRLTNRSGQGKEQPWAVVVTTHLPHPETSLFLLQNRASQLVFLTTPEQAGSEVAQSLQELGTRVWGLPEVEHGGLNLRTGLQSVYQDLGCTELLCEGGGRLAMGLMQADLVDELHLVLAPRVLGDDRAVSVFSGRMAMSMDEAVNWRLVSSEQVGADLWLIYRRPHVNAQKADAGPQSS
ncbi:MAG: bifunctional diaminohydroxyphosphoribosylaminopyrimidine deaminase/5-amino-6-(5-phosphoribosylamino)uracil reductase RibD [Thermodesulfobacteriota bacterium]